jgi:glycosyltransferase involved in cell wall biosynthesis
MIGTLPPIKAISPYCVHIFQELAARMKADYIGFYSLPDFLYSGGSKDSSYIIQTPDNIKISYLLKWWNPFSWTQAAIKASGDIIHIQHWMPYTLIIHLWMMPILKLRGKTIVITVHNITPHSNDRLLKVIDKVFNTFIFKFAHGFIVHNERNRLRFQRLYHINSEKILIATHGPIRPEIRGITQEDARTLLGIAPEKKILLFFGYLWKYKGLDTLLQALKGIVENVPEALLLVAGQPITIQGDWAPYQSIIKKNHLENNVLTWLRFIPESQLEVFFKAADIVVLPYHEPFDTHGGAAALTISYHKPLLVTDIGGLPNYVKDERAISPPNDVKALERNIIRILENDQMLIDLAKDSEEKERELGWGPIAEKTIQFYELVLLNS